MKNKPLFTAAGLLLALVSVLLLFIANLREVAAVAALAGYFISWKDFSKFTGPFQFLTQLIAGLLTGITLDYPFLHFPFFSICFLLVTLATCGRIIFFRHFAYTGKSWFEPILLLLSVAAHVTGIVYSNGEVLAIFIPSLALVFAFIIAWGIRKDKRFLLAKTKPGYRISEGQPAPPFRLEANDGNFVSLSDFYGARHVLLIFVRGDWCPGCHMMLRTYQRESEKFKAKNIFVLSIGPDPVGVNREMVERLGLDFKVLSDAGQKTAMLYGVQLQEYENAFAEKYDEGIPLPASFLVDKKGIVRYISRPDKVGEFLNPSLIFPIIDKLT
ncbi:MAG TPA: redoxin domain-containing protein [Bacteroidia bacterium]|nr:redoxin domain-containing protein [Bacteroidia bacterium]